MNVEPFEYCTKCGIVYFRIQNAECVVCHGRLRPINNLVIDVSDLRLPIQDEDDSEDDS